MECLTCVGDLSFGVVASKWSRFEDRGVQEARFAACVDISEADDAFGKLHQDSHIIALIL